MEYDNQYNPESVISEEKPSKKRWLWWSAGCMVLICLGLCVSASFYLLSDQSQLLNVTYIIPPSVQQGDEFEFVIIMSNLNKEDVLVRHIVLDETIGPSILDGSSVISTEPEMKIDETYLPDKIAYSYFRTIQFGESETVVFHLRAEEVGEFGGPVSAYSSINPLNSMAFYLDPVMISITP